MLKQCNCKEWQKGIEAFIEKWEPDMRDSIREDIEKNWNYCVWCGKKLDIDIKLRKQWKGK